MEPGDVICVVPARLDSKRLPRKVMACAGGKPMLIHSAQGGQMAGFRTIIACDCQELADTAAEHGFESVIAERHPNGTSRVFAAIRSLGIKPAVIVNIQADDPDVSPGDIRSLAAKAYKSSAIQTLIGGECSSTDLYNVDTVKAIVGYENRCHYFTRQPVPSAKLHIVEYAFPASVEVVMFTSPMADSERLEQLAWLECGHTIEATRATVESHGINNEWDLRQWKLRHHNP